MFFNMCIANLILSIPFESSILPSRKNIVRNVATNVVRKNNRINHSAFLLNIISIFD